MTEPFHYQSWIRENQIEAEVSSYLGELTPLWHRRFRLISENEQSTGSDKVFNQPDIFGKRFIPIYIQFKSSHGLKPLNDSEMEKPKSKIQRIRHFRKKNKIDSDPILYFQLRRKAKNATDFQHNVLRSFSRPPTSYATYVAPLFLEEQEYVDCLQSSWYHRILFTEPFRFFRGHVYMDDNRNLRREVITNQPFLRGHMSIIPHVEVKSNNHYYSFSSNGFDVAWHSGRILNSIDSRLSAFIKAVLTNFYAGESMNIESFNSEMSQFLNGENSLKSINEFSDSQDSLLSIFSSFLKKTYNIRLFILREDK